jgi:hypothetical protein
MFVLMVLQPTLPVQTSEAASRITVPRDYPTIQSAIDAAKPGDTIKVLPGTYPEQITISKSLTLIGTGDKVTIIKAPATLPKTNTNGDPYVVDINGGAKVNMKGFTVSGPSRTSCPLSLIGISVMLDSTLNLDTSSIRDCTYNGIYTEGDATIIRTNVNNYREHGIFGFGEVITVKVSHSNIVAAKNSEVAGTIGILLVLAKGVIDHNKISENICTVSECGTDYSQPQSYGIVTVAASSGSSITNNVLSNNDAGIDLILSSGCCIVDRNIIRNSAPNDLFFGVVVQDGENTISNTKISGDKVLVGVLAAAFEVDTVATLDRAIIKNAEMPTKTISDGATAKVVFVPRSVITIQSMSPASVPTSLPIPLPN